MPVEGLAIDYFNLTEKLNGEKRKIILFLGSNIGNYSYEESLQFLTYLKSIMNSNDMILIGFDLKKDVDLILRAYNDPHGYTAAFNLNLLQRINDELDADFNLQNFSHKEIYDEQTGEAKSYLFCQKAHVVNINTLNKNFAFKAGEKIFMEISQKYDLSIIEDLAKHSGFKITRNFYDRRQFFVNSLWTVNS